MAPVIMGNPDRPELGRRAHRELLPHGSRRSPRRFARVTFLSDNRADLAAVRVPDAGAAVLRRRDRARRRSASTCTRTSPGASWSSCEATGHCPNLSAPDETIAAIRSSSTVLTVRVASERRALTRFYAALLDDDAEELYEHAPCGYLSRTPDGTIVKVNAHASCA